VIGVKIGRFLSRFRNYENVDVPSNAITAHRANEQCWRQALAPLAASSKRAETQTAALSGLSWMNSAPIIAGCRLAAALHWETINS